MSNSNAYGQQPQYGQPPAQNATMAPQGNKWPQVILGFGVVSAVVVLIVNFLKWVQMDIVYGTETAEISGNGWAKYTFDNVPDDVELPESEFGGAGLGVLVGVLIISLLIVGAVMAWQKVQPRVAVSLFIAGAGIYLVWTIWQILDFNNSMHQLEDEYAAQLRAYGMEFNELFDGSVKFGAYLAIIVALAIIAFGIFALVKVGSQPKTPANNLGNFYAAPQGQWGQPGPQGQWGQPGQPGPQTNF